MDTCNPNKKSKTQIKMIKKLIVAALLILPAMAFAQTYPLISIHDLQYVDDQNLANGLDSALQYVGDTVQVEGVVTFDPCYYGLSPNQHRNGTFLSQVNATGAWSALHILIEPGAIGLGSAPADLQQLSDDADYYDNCVYGNTVKVTGIFKGYSNNTQLYLLPIQTDVTSFSNPIPAPIVMQIDSFEKSDGQGGQAIQIPSGEKYEGVYVELHNVRVVDVTVTSSGTRINWSIQDDFGNKMKIRDMSGYFRNDTADNFCTSAGSITPTPFDTPIVNSVLAFIRGVIVEYKTGTGPYEYFLAPLTLADIGPTTYSAPVITINPVAIPVPSTSQAQTVSASIVDFDGTVSSATLYYASGLSNNVFTSVAMTNTSGNNWQATIPALGPDSTYIKFWIKAIDNDGHQSNTPDSLGTNSFYLIKNAGITSLVQLNFHPLGYFSSPYANQTITNMNVPGTVISTTSIYDEGSVFIQDGQIPWTGIALKGSNVISLQRGDRINITKAKVIEDFGITTLDSITYTVTSQVPVIQPILGLPIDSVIAAKYNYTEKYEGMLIGYNSVFVVNQNPDAPSSDFGEWSIYTNSSTTSGLRCDDQSNDIGFGFNADSLSLNQPLNYIYGILVRSFSNWKMWPRNRDDIAGFQVIYIGIDELQKENTDWTIYPNPINNELNIQYSGSSKNLFVELFDAAGKKVMEQKGTFPNSVLNVQSLSSGTYVLQLNDGTNTLHSKIVKLK